MHSGSFSSMYVSMILFCVLAFLCYLCCLCLHCVVVVSTPDPLSWSKTTVESQLISWLVE